MRTTSKWKLVLLVSLSSLLLTACGGKNKSGGSKSNSTDNWGGGTILNNGNGQTLPPNWRDIVRQENPCDQGGNRATVSFPLNGANANAGAIYVGASPFGDIAYVNNNGNQTMMTIEVCPRAGASGQGSLLSNPVLNNSYDCPVGEITAVDMVLQGQYQQYQVKFAPISVQGYKTSSLCTGGGYNNQYPYPQQQPYPPYY